MEKSSVELIKNIGIALLAIIAIILIITVICYNKISIGKLVPKVETYELSEEIKNELESETSEEDSEIIVTYELDASDLKKYEKTKEYNKGKKNPFASEEVGTIDNNEDTSSQNDSSSENDTSSENFYEDGGIK